MKPVPNSGMPQEPTGPENRVVLKAQALGGREDCHGLRVVQGDGLGVTVGHILQHADHRRVIVAQHIQLQKVLLHAVVFKMRRDGIGAGVIRRVLDGAEVADLVFLGDDDQAAGVLARRSLDADAAQGQPLLLGAADDQVTLGQVFFDIAEGRLFRDGTDGPGSEDVVWRRTSGHSRRGPGPGILRRS